MLKCLKFTREAKMIRTSLLNKRLFGAFNRKALLPNGVWPRFLSIVLCTIVFQWTTVIQAQTVPTPPPDFVSGLDISEALVALVSFATTPGISSANFEISWPDDQPHVDVEKYSIELELDFDLRSRYFKLFAGIGFNYFNWDDKLVSQNSVGETVIIDPDRDIYAARMSGGLTFQLTPHIRATPYLSFILAELDSKSTVRGTDDLDNLDPALRPFVEDFNTKSTTLAGTLELKYDRWFDRRRIEMFGRYTYSYTDTFDESEDFIESSGDVNVLDFEGRWTAPTGLHIRGIPLRWKLIGGYTHLLDVDKESLGFRYFFEYGGGFDLEVDVRPFDLFNLRNVGLNLVGITGDDISGWSFAISLTN